MFSPLLFISEVLLESTTGVERSVSLDGTLHMTRQLPLGGCRVTLINQAEVLAFQGVAP
jgi:hypothetical protein